jgi:hypothetical protein
VRRALLLVLSGCATWGHPLGQARAGALEAERANPAAHERTEGTCTAAGRTVRWLGQRLGTGVARRLAYDEATGVLLYVETAPFEGGRLDRYGDMPGCAPSASLRSAPSPVNSFGVIGPPPRTSSDPPPGG